VCSKLQNKIAILIIASKEDI